MVEDLPQIEEIQNHGADSVQALPSNRDEILKQASFSAQRESRPHDSRSEPILLNWDGFVRKLPGIIQEELHDQAQLVTHSKWIRLSNPTLKQLTWQWVKRCWLLRKLAKAEETWVQVRDLA